MEKAREAMCIRKLCFVFALLCVFLLTRSESTGDCSFDNFTLCNWTKVQTNGAEWTLLKDRTPSINTGPSHDHSGSGFYIYVESSSPILYDQKARLLSPVLNGPLTMSFFYHMFGATIETLSVYVAFGLKETRVWSRHGNHGDKWLPGCVNITMSGNYRIIIEAYGSGSYTGDIAVDEITFKDGLLVCNNTGEETPPETFNVNCTFEDSFCGWRSLAYKRSNDLPLQWTRGNMASNGYLYVNTTYLSSPGYFAYLLSPRTTGPQCLRFIYSMRSDVIGTLEVLLFEYKSATERVSAEWTTQGTKDGPWRNATVSLPFQGTYQIMVVSGIDPGNSTFVAIDNVTVRSGLCDKEDDHARSHGDCDFERSLSQNGFCLWTNEIGNDFDWYLGIGETFSRFTGPFADHTTGTGYYAFVESSKPNNPGERARLASPILQGEFCLQFFYHMRGDTMSLLVVFSRGVHSRKYRLLWVKSGDRGGRWHKGVVTVKGVTTEELYQVVFEGILGISYRGDAAIDDVTFTKGACITTELTTYHVGSHTRVYSVQLLPGQYNGWSAEFSFDVSTIPSNSTVTYIYTPQVPHISMFSATPRLYDPIGFPLDRFYQDPNGPKIYTHRLPSSEFYSLQNDSHAQCCMGRDTVRTVHVSGVRQQDPSISFGCIPGWHRIGASCYMFFRFPAGYTPWAISRYYCHSFGGELATPKSTLILDRITNITYSFGDFGLAPYVALRGQIKWSLGDNGPLVEYLWGESEPSGDGMCGVLRKNTKPKTWRWNDVPCPTEAPVLCQDNMVIPNPVALFPLCGPNIAQEASPDALPDGVLSNIYMSPGPRGHSNNSARFTGFMDSFITFPNNGALDIISSITILAWIYPTTYGGTIFNYGSSPSGVHISLVFPGKLSAEFYDRDVPKSFAVVTGGVIPLNKWSYIGVVYDYSSGLTRLFVKNETVTSRRIYSLTRLDTRGDVRVGSLPGRTGYKGRISCLQIYDVALSDWKVLDVREICTKKEPISCKQHSIPLRGRCIFTNSTVRLSGLDAPNHCTSREARMAIIDKEYVRAPLAKFLETSHPETSQAHIGLLAQEYWVWPDGSSVDKLLWKQGFPRSFYGTQTCVCVDPVTSRLTNNFLCTGSRGFVCQKNQLNLASGRPTSFSSIARGGVGAYAVDGLYSTCFATLQESKPFLRITLDAEVFIYKVTLANNRDCCREALSSIVALVTDRRGYIRQCGDAVSYGLSIYHEFVCKLPMATKFLTITSMEAKNFSLVACEVVTYSFRNPQEANGVKRELWKQVSYKQTTTMRDNPVFKSSASLSHVITSFDAPRDADENYAQRLTGYLQVPFTGNYTFYISCDDQCELWKFDVEDEGIGYQPIPGDMKRMSPLTKADQRTAYNQWFRYPSQVSVPVFLHHCFFYKLQAYMREGIVSDHLSVGMRLASGKYELPIPGERLYSQLPGKRQFEVSFGNNGWISEPVGSDVNIFGDFLYCCDGVYCPNCPMHIVLLLNGQRFVLNEKAPMTCNKTRFGVRYGECLQPGNYSALVEYSFANETVMKELISVGTLEMKSTVLEKCFFSKNFCGWKNGGAYKWKLASGKQPLDGKHYFAFTDAQDRVTMKTQSLPWQPFQRNIGVCLKFSYHMGNTSDGHLVIQLQIDNHVHPVWNLSGFHGNSWNEGQVSWSGEPSSKVVFTAWASQNTDVRVAIAEIVFITGRCAVQPPFALPGHECLEDEFGCENGQCVKRGLLCDGDKACLDGSDEKHCSCPSNMFLCPSGECIPTTALCNNENDCSDNADERNCHRECSSGDEFQCVGGGCIRWSSTCRAQQLCPGFTDNPAICEYANCSLNNLGCRRNIDITQVNEEERKCKPLLTRCKFENGLCGMTLDETSGLKWSLGSGKTPTEKTGPSNDHSTLSDKGSYLYIEASGHKQDEAARLVSGVLDANETVCLQFWYHMYGRHIGSLRVIITSNTTATLVWEQRGDKGDVWRYGQIALKSAEEFRFIIEATTTNGNKGDIALDDMTVIRGSCKTIAKQRSMDCDFEDGMCGWTGHKDWAILHSDWRNEHHISLLPVSGSSFKNLTSPLFNQKGFKWKCLRLWYDLHSDLLQPWLLPTMYVVLETPYNNTVLTVIVSSAHQWRFLQSPIPQHLRNIKIAIVGLHPYEDSYAQLNIDNIELSRDLCEPIPWKEDSTKHNVTCDLDLEWCGWKNVYNDTSGLWVASDYNATASYKNYIDEYNWKMNDTQSKEPEDSGDFQVTFHRYSPGIIQFTKMPRLLEFSMCFWIKSFYQGFYVEYKTKTEMATTLEFVVDVLDWLMFKIGSQVGAVPTNIVDGAWHMVCFVWAGLGKPVVIYIDGKKAGVVYPGYYARVPALGDLVIGHRPAEDNAKDTLSTLGSFNLWSSTLKAEAIKRMSFGCGGEHGDVREWFMVLANIQGHIGRKRRRECTDSTAKRIIFQSGFNNKLTQSFSAKLVGPHFSRSVDSSSVCLRFRYMMYGPGVQRLSVAQKVGNGSMVPVWEDDASDKTWRYGQTPLMGIHDYKVEFSGTLDGRRPGFIAVGYAFIASGFCVHWPEDAKKACSQDFTDAPGYITSPQYPGPYIANSHCVWRIIAPENYVIRLDILDMRLQDHVTCAKDYVAVHDGSDVASPLIGRYCGFIHPELIESTSNHMTILFHSDAQFHKRGLKALYRFLKGNREQSDVCLRKQGCPSGCTCSDIMGDQQGRIVVESEQQLLAMPANLPSRTAAVMFQENRISSLTERNYHYLQYLLHFDLSFNIITNLNARAFTNVTSLDTLRLNSNFLQRIPPLVFKDMQNLKVLDLSRNLLTKLENGAFDGLTNLNVLSLRMNKLESFPRGLFNITANLTQLFLQHNRIVSVHDGQFRSLQNLKVLDLSSNNLTRLTKDTFEGLESLTELYLHDNKLRDVDADAFDDLHNLKYLKLDFFILCCYARKSVPGVTCESPSDDFSSCEDLMKNKYIRVCVWILGLMALLGNMSVILWRILDKETNQIHSMLLLNLAFSDLLMGVYLLLIAIMDTKWQGEYFKHDIEWRSGIGCQVAGILSMLSSEVSVLILTVITADRLACIVFPFKFKRLKKRSATFTCTVVWIFSLVISVLPVAGLEYFYDKKGYFGFYGRSAVCLALQLSEDRPAGWEYAVVIFIGVNLVAFMFMLFAYIAMFWTVKRVSRAVRSTSMSKESAMAKKLIFIILTDFCCWMPVIVIGILSLTGVFHDPRPN
ncbi:uncharacterized protein LOC5504590 isoform X1 [Nematostella vectensis]|uniref:uncharacterized protein LOC5504590 isoform X1 n=2 Tax=Nematostella vectensis TaxID=45351 RepID=UPI0020775CCC|nr:uncharacterized protein LOC5504590 isoform X1 [Nematostella vectensis]